MKKSIRTYLLLAGLVAPVIFSGCVVNVVEDAIKKQSVQDAHTFTSLSVDDQESSDLVVSGYSGDSITASADLSVWANTDAKAKEIADALSFGWNTATAEARLAVTYAKDQELAKLVGLHITSPDRLSLTLESSSGDISVSHMKNSVTAESSSGDVSIETEGRTTVKSSSGDVRITTAKGGTVDATSGSVLANITSAAFDGLTIDNSSGDVTVNIVDGAHVTLDLETSSGDIDVNYSGVSTRSSDGELRIDVNGGGRVVRVNTSSGDVLIRTLH